MWKNWNPYTLLVGTENEGTSEQTAWQVLLTHAPAFYSEVYNMLALRSASLTQSKYQMPSSNEWMVQSVMCTQV